MTILATDELFPLVYHELRRRASRQMANEREDHTLQPTALVHDVYLRMVAGHQTQRWESKAHFFAAAANAMRRILIDYARKQSRKKRGGDFRRHDLIDVCLPQTSVTAEQLLELDDALQKLESSDSQVAELVRLRIFAGLSITEAAPVLRVSRTAGYELWNYALAWFSIEFSSWKAANTVA